MTPTLRGAFIGAAAILMITIIWTALAGGDREGACSGVEYACFCRPVPPAGFLVGGLVVGVPWGAIVGAFAGSLTARVPRHRRLILLVIAVAGASLLERIAHLFLHCSSDPDSLALWSTAVVSLVLAALALDRAAD